MKELLAEAFLVLHLGFGLPPPNRFPQFILETEASMPCRHCEGAYRTGVIWMRGDLPRDAAWKAKLLHEARHHLQFEAAGGRDAADCADWIRREHEGYAVQIAALERANLDARSAHLVLAQLTCRTFQ